MVAVEGEKITGYAVIRRCRNGYKIGPLFADTEEMAEKLFIAVNDFAEPGSPVSLDTPGINRAAIELAGRHGMFGVYETARMSSKSFPDIDVNRVFGVTTFELG